MEYGTQSADDYLLIFNQIYDPFQRVKIAWDINHLLHAIGYREETKQGAFFLPPWEINDSMRALEREYGKSPQDFAHNWLVSQICHPSLIHLVGSIHLSDCGLKKEEYFRNGSFQAEYLKKIRSLSTWNEKEEYGVSIVLSEYDNHIPLGKGILDPFRIREMCEKVQKSSPDLVILHELKNSIPLEKAIDMQLNNFWGN